MEHNKDSHDGREMRLCQNIKHHRISDFDCNDDIKEDFNRFQCHLFT